MSTLQNRKNHNQKKRGQALFEFLVFLPIMISLFSITVSISNAINGSINQQKITRGYFYNQIHNDTTTPGRRVLSDMRGQSVGMFALGWRLMESPQQFPIAPCYKLFTLSNTSGLNTSGSGAVLEECSPGMGVKAPFIRVKTVYGVCTESYYLFNGTWQRAINIGAPVASSSSCLISSN